MRKVAVVLFNLGGPDGPEAVRPFLFNLFNDPAIIGLPAPFRTWLAGLISSRREELAKANYAIMGGGSPLLPETQKQAAALEQALAERLPAAEARCFIAMRYWRPFVEDAAREVRAWGADEVVLLPLYPQYSTTTTGSSLTAWRRAFEGPAKAVCCYPEAAGFADAYAQAILAEAAKAKGVPLRLLFSAHGLPEKVVKGGDPYQAQVEASVGAVLARLQDRFDDWEICYQSRVGPLKWIGPATDAAVVRAAREGKGILLAPIAFVSEHVETLVELDHEYAKLAKDNGATVYLRAPAVGVMPSFIGSLAEAVTGALLRAPGVETCGGGRWCEARWRRCPARAAA